MILEETCNYLFEKHSDLLGNLTISDVRVGLFLTAVRLSDGSCGVAGTLCDGHTHCDKKDRDFGDFTPSQIKGRRVIDLLKASKKNNITDTLKTAALNAVSTRILADSGYKILENTDPFDLIDLNQERVITIVGGFHSYIEKISLTKNKLFVLELNENALSGKHKKYYVPAEKYLEVLPVSDIVIITGLTLVNKTIDGLLSSISTKTHVIVTGPSSSIIPDILFSYGVNAIGATRINNPEMLFAIVGEGGTGYHLFKYCAQKISILNK